MPLKQSNSNVRDNNYGNFKVIRLNALPTRCERYAFKRTALKMQADSQASLHLRAAKARRAQAVDHSHEKSLAIHQRS